MKLKKVLTLIPFLALLASCGGGGDNSSPSSTAPSDSSGTTSESESEPGTSTTESEDSSGTPGSTSSETTSESSEPEPDPGLTGDAKILNDDGNANNVTIIAKLAASGNESTAEYYIGNTRVLQNEYMDSDPEDNYLSYIELDVEDESIDVYNKYGPAWGEYSTDWKEESFYFTSICQYIPAVKENIFEQIAKVVKAQSLEPVAGVYSINKVDFTIDVAKYNEQQHTSIVVPTTPETISFTDISFSIKNDHLDSLSLKAPGLDDDGTKVVVTETVATYSLKFSEFGTTTVNPPAGLFDVTETQFNDSFNIKYKNRTIEATMDDGTIMDSETLRMKSDGSYIAETSNGMRVSRYDEAAEVWRVFDKPNELLADGLIEGSSYNEANYETFGGGYFDPMYLTRILPSITYSDAFTLDPTSHVYRGSVEISSTPVDVTARFVGGDCKGINLTVDTGAAEPTIYDISFTQYDDIQFPNWMGFEDWKDDTINGYVTNRMVETNMELLYSGTNVNPHSLYDVNSALYTSELPLPTTRVTDDVYQVSNPYQFAEVLDYYAFYGDSTTFYVALHENYEDTLGGFQGGLDQAIYRAYFASLLCSGTVGVNQTYVPENRTYAISLIFNADANRRTTTTGVNKSTLFPFVPSSDTTNAFQATETGNYVVYVNNSNQVYVSKAANVPVSDYYTNDFYIFVNGVQVVIDECNIKENEGNIAEFLYEFHEGDQVVVKHSSDTLPFGSSTDPYEVGTNGKYRLYVYNNDGWKVSVVRKDDIPTDYQLYVNGTQNNTAVRTYKDGDNADHAIYNVHLNYGDLVLAKYNGDELVSQGKVRSNLFEDFPGLNSAAPHVTVYNSEQLMYVLEKGYYPEVIVDSPADLLLQRAKNILREIIRNDMTQRDKIAAISAWMASNVDYDTPGDENAVYFQTEQYFPDKVASTYRSFYAEGALLDGRAVCQGHAKAFNILATLEGINSVKVSTALSSTEFEYTQIGCNEYVYNDNHEVIKATYMNHGLSFVLDEITGKYYVCDSTFTRAGNYWYQYDDNPENRDYYSYSRSYGMLLSYDQWNGVYRESQDFYHYALGNSLATESLNISEYLTSGSANMVFEKVNNETSEETVARLTTYLQHVIDDVDAYGTANSKREHEMYCVNIYIEDLEQKIAAGTISDQEIYQYVDYMNSAINNLRKSDQLHCNYIQCGYTQYYNLSNFKGLVLITLY